MTCTSSHSITLPHHAHTNLHCLAPFTASVLRNEYQDNDGK
jgi:hypothetical protein